MGAMIMAVLINFKSGAFFSVGLLPITVPVVRNCHRLLTPTATLTRETRPGVVVAVVVFAAVAGAAPDLVPVGPRGLDPALTTAVAATTRPEVVD
jgi:hypothetical protein